TLDAHQVVELVAQPRETGGRDVVGVRRHGAPPLSLSPLARILQRPSGAGASAALSRGASLVLVLRVPIAAGGTRAAARGLLRARRAAAFAGLLLLLRRLLVLLLRLVVADGAAAGRARHGVAAAGLVADKPADRRALAAARRHRLRRGQRERAEQGRHDENITHA